MSISACSKEFIFAMVQAMYHYEAHQVGDHHRLLNNKEEMDFYWAYMGC